MNTRKHLTVKRLTGAIVAAATMTAVLLVAPSTMASEPSALDKYKNESSLLVDLNFNDLTAGQTGTYQSGNIVIRIVSVCFIISIPIAWMGTQQWLENFAYKTPLHLWVFIVAFLIILSVTIGTVTFRNWQAANENPVNSVKSE